MCDTSVRNVNTEKCMLLTVFDLVSFAADCYVQNDGLAVYLWSSGLSFELA